MAGAKHIRRDCEATKLTPRKTSSCVVCICGSRSKSLPLGRPCMVCGISADDWKAARSRKCVVCGKEFQVTRGNASVCGDLACVEAAKVLRVNRAVYKQSVRAAANAKQRESYVARYGRQTIQTKEDLLGPEEPEMPMRKCHERCCNEMTTQYRCEKCRAKWRASEGASGLSGTAELFSGGYLEQGARCGC